MADKRFFTLAGPFTLGQLAEMTGSELSDPVAATASVVDVAPLQDADATRVSFLDNKKYVDTFKATKAGACFVRPELAAFAPKGTVCLMHKNPYKAYAIAAAAFYPVEPVREFRAPTATIDPAAIIGRNCHIGPGVFVGKNAQIGEGCRIGANAVIEAGVILGEGCDIGPGVYISHAVLGKRVRLHPGAVVGSPGFGFAIDPAGYVSVPQLGRVLIGDDADIGANSTIDRGAGPDTVIGQGTRIDNLVQVAHNVKIGKFCIIAGQAGVSGSTEIGDYVMIGGQAGLAGHLKVGAGVKVAGGAGIMRDIEPKSEVMGYPAVPIKQFMRQTALLSRLVNKKKTSEEE